MKHRNAWLAAGGMAGMLVAAAWADPTLTVTSGLALRLESINVDGSNNSTLTDGDPVATWVDLSGSGNDHAQATATWQPRYVANQLGWGSVPVVRFTNDGDGTFDRLTKSMDYSGFTGISAFVVMIKQNTSQSWAMFVGTGNGYNGGNWSFRRAVATADTLDFYLGDASTPFGAQITGYTDGSLVILSGTYAYGTGNDAVFRMIETDRNVTVDTATGTYTQTGTVTASVGDRSNEGAALYGDVAAVLVYNRELSESEVTAVENYLWDRYLSDGTPTAILTASPTSGTSVPLDVSFDGTASRDADGSLVSYAWDFGDGRGRSGGTTAFHRYKKPGVYVAKLTVTDNDGKQHSDHVMIKIPPVTSGLALWLDAGNTDGMGNDSLADGDGVMSWMDLSGNGYDHTPASTARAPILDEGAMGPQSRDVLNFNDDDGTFNSVRVEIDYSGFTGLSCFIVARRDVSSTWAFLCGIGGGYNNDEWSITQNGGTASAWRCILGSASAPIAYMTGYELGEYVLMSGTYAYGASETLTMRMTETNDVTTVSTGSGTYSQYGTVNSALGGRANDTYETTGSIVEYLLYDRKLNGTEVDAVETYLWEKYFIPPPPPEGSLFMIL